MSLLLPDSGLLFWMLLSFGVVFVVLAKYGFPVITKMVEERRVRMRNRVLLPFAAARIATGNSAAQRLVSRNEGVYLRFVAGR